MQKFVINPLVQRKHLRWPFYRKNYECIIPALFMIADCIWMATSTYHGFKHYDIIVTNAARDRHEEYDQFLKFYCHQWWITPGLREDLSKPRRDMYELYTEMEKRWRDRAGKQEVCEK